MSAVKTQKEIAQIVARVGQLPAMPTVAGRVLQLVESPDATAERLQRVIETDPALTAAVLRLVNSAMFSLPGRIATLSHAITLIGFLRLRSLTMATVVAGLKRLIPESAADIRDRIWEHSVSVALASRTIAEKKRFPWAEEAFVSGLLHDCGRLLLLGSRTEESVALWAEHESPTPEQELSRLGFDHQQAGAALLKSWRIPEPHVIVSGDHHGAEPPAGPHSELVAVVMLADRLMKQNASESPHAPARRIGMHDVDLDELAEQLHVKVRAMRRELLTL